MGTASRHVFRHYNVYGEASHQIATWGWLCWPRRRGQGGHHSEEEENVQGVEGRQGVVEAEAVSPTLAEDNGLKQDEDLPPWKCRSGTRDKGLWRVGRVAGLGQGCTV